MFNCYQTLMLICCSIWENKERKKQTKNLLPFCSWSNPKRGEGRMQAQHPSEAMVPQAKEGADTLPTSPGQQRSYPWSPRAFQDGSVKWPCVHTSLYKDYFLNHHVSRWNPIHWCCSILVKIATAFCQPCCTDQTQIFLPLLVISRIPQPHQSLNYNSEALFQNKQTTNLKLCSNWTVFWWMYSFVECFWICLCRETWTTKQL